MARPYAASYIFPKLKKPVAWSCESNGFLNVGHPSTEDARETRLCEVPLGGTLDVACLAKFAFRNLSLELSLELERFDRRFRPFGSGITDEVLLARHINYSHHLDIRRSSLSCSLGPFTHQCINACVGPVVSLSL
jgi:hypothetical protein